MKNNVIKFPPANGRPLPAQIKELTPEEIVDRILASLGSNVCTSRNLIKAFMTVINAWGEVYCVQRGISEEDMRDMMADIVNQQLEEFLK